MAKQSAAIHCELVADAEHAAAQLRLPPVPEDKRQKELMEREDKVMRIRDSEVRRTGLGIKDRSPSKTRE